MTLYKDELPESTTDTRARSMTDTAKMLVVLQCAYGDTAHRRQQLKDRRLWLKALWASHTGRRLTEMLPDDFDVEVINSTPEIGKSSDAVLPPDNDYVARMIEVYEPDIVLACGRVAQGVLCSLGIDYVPAPHPAWRALSKTRTNQVRQRLERQIRE